MKAPFAFLDFELHIIMGKASRGIKKEVKQPHMSYRMAQEIELLSSDVEESHTLP